MSNEENRTRRLNYVAYANIGLGMFILFAWALPGPWMVPNFWHGLDQSLAGKTDPVLATFVTLMKAMVVVVIVCFWVFSAVSLVNGYLILKRRRHQLCMILSGVSIAGGPPGMVVGIISLVVLNRDWVRRLFRESAEARLN